MKKRRVLALVFAAALILALFSGCGGTTNPPETTKAPGGDAPAQTPAATDGGAAPTDAPATAAPATEEPEEGGVFYHYAKGNNPNVDAAGLPTGPYNYELPLTNSDEILTMWTTCWIPFVLDEGGYPESPFPVEMERQTGVHVEYDIVPGESRSENFSVLLAADNLDDIMSNANFFYTSGSFKKAVVEEEFFINIYDYREYCPNYIWQALCDPTDEATYNSVFTEDDLITTFYFLWDQGLIQMDYFFRGDWLEKLGMTNDDIQTFDDLHDALAACQSQFDKCTYPMTYYSTLEMSGTYAWTAYDTYFCASRFGLVYVQDGQVKHANMNDNDRALMTMANQWYNDGLIDPNWASFSSDEDFNDKIDGQLAYVMLSANGASEHPGCIDPDASVGWVPVRRPLLYEGQTLHLGGDTTRTHYGSAAISATCENIPLAVTWVDWRYSEEGAMFCTWGVEGLTWEYNDKGEREYTPFYYAPELTSMTMLATVYLSNELTDPGMHYHLQRYSFPGGEGAVYAHTYWANYDYDAAYRWPTAITFTDEQRERINQYSSDIGTYISENYIAFVDNSKSLNEWDSYVAGLEAIGMNEALAVYQEAYDAYLAEKAA